MSATKILWFLAVSTAAFAPVLLFLVNGADFTGIASESIAYRFFYSMRLFAGPDLTAWLPQGHLITALQHVINYFLLPTMDGSLDSLRATLNAFSYWSIAAINAIMVVVFLLAACASSITWQDRTLLTIVAFAPIYANAYRRYGPIIISSTCILSRPRSSCFSGQWRSGSTAHPLLRTIGAGVFVGALTANKISMLFVGGPLVVAVWRRAARNDSIPANSTVVWFDAKWLKSVLDYYPKLAAAITNPTARHEHMEFSSAGFHFRGEVVGHIVQIQ